MNDTVKVTCFRCRGSGKFYGRGEWVNDVFKGFIGVCFNCAGKGHTTSEDDKRNNWYWKYYGRINA